MPIYSYYDYLEAYYEYYYDYWYWPSYYNASYFPEVYNGTYPPSPWTHEHDYDYHSAAIFIYFYSWTCCLLAYGIFGFAAYRIISNLKRGKKASDNKVAMILVMVSLLSHVLLNTLDTVFEHYWWIDYPGWDNFKNVWQTWNAMVLVSKMTIYILYIHRFYLIFNATSLTNENYKRDRVIIISFYSVAMAIQVVLSTMWILSGIPDFNDDEVLTAESLTNWLSISFAFFDLAFCASIGTVLVRSILNLVLVMTSYETGTKSQSTIEISAEPPTQSKPSKVETELEKYMQTDEATTTDDTKTNDESSAAPSMTSAGSTESATQSKPKSPSALSSSASSTSQSSMSSESRRKNTDLIHVTTKIALTCTIAMISSFVYNLTFPLAKEIEWRDLEWVVWTWATDVVINMIAIYLSMSVAHKDYKLICYDKCKCHQCCLKCLLKVTPSEISATMASTELKTRL